jgi:recombinational DNA repair protein (RecF pathway)
MGILRADLRRMSGAGLVCAWARDLARREDSLAQYRLLHRTLTHINQPTVPVAPAVARFLWRMTSLSGVGPTLFGCVDCRTTSNLTAFRYNPGGVVCASCQNSADRPFPEVELKAVQVVAEGEREAWQSLPDNPSRPLVSLAQSYLRHHFGDHLPQRETG